MSRTLLQTGHEEKDQGSNEICRTAHALPASSFVRRALFNREITYARSSVIAKQVWRFLISITGKKYGEGRKFSLPMKTRFER